MAELPKPDTASATKNADMPAAKAHDPYSAGANSLVRIGVVIKAVIAGRNCAGEYNAMSLTNFPNMMLRPHRFDLMLSPDRISSE